MSMKCWVARTFAAGIVLAGMMAVLMPEYVAAADDDQAVLQADHALMQAIGGADKKALGSLLDTDFTWTDAAGKTLTKAEVLNNVPTPATGYDANPTERTYGDVGEVQANSGKVYVLRLWVKRPAGWRALDYHEVKQLDAPPTGGGPGVDDCENPCRTVPYKPKNQAEQDIITSWQQLETAVTAHNAAGWDPHGAEEFVQVSSSNDHPLDKKARMAVLDKQKQAGVGAAPAPLVSAEMFDLGDTVVMKALHQPFHGKPVRVSRIWIKRDGKWVMATSYQTTIQAAAAKE
jgi:hypothetical protein